MNNAFTLGGGIKGDMEGYLGNNPLTVMLLPMWDLRGWRFISVNRNGVKSLIFLPIYSSIQSS